MIKEDIQYEVEDEFIPTFEEELLIGFNYEGGLEQYEDPADTFVVKGLSGRILA